MSELTARPTVRIAAGLVAVAWFAAAVAGFRSIDAFESTPGRSGRVPGTWPGDATSRPRPGRPNVVVALHPRCPCSRSGLGALADIVRRSGSAASVRILVFRPESGEVDWGLSPPPPEALGWGADLVDDPGGVEAARFGLATSGAVAAYDARGRLRFTGGLTTSRSGGRSGGAGSLLAVLRGREPDRGESTVFGCGLGRPTLGAREGSGAR